MTSQIYDFGIIGGDVRQVYLAGILAEKGFRVCTYALENKLIQDFGNRTGDITVENSLKEAAGRSRVCIAPIPFSKNGMDINCGIQKAGRKISDMKISDLEDVLENEQILAAGCIPDRVKKCLAKKGVFVLDFMEDEELAIYNTVATAEGAVAEAILKSPFNLRGSRCLVLGYGKCAKTLCSYLKGMSCRVTVCARKPAARALAAITADEVIHLDALKKNLRDVSFIFNTVPACILDRELLGEVERRAVIIDIASAPGGLDYAAAGELGVHAFSCQGLPGKYAPASSAEAMAKALTRKSVF